MNKQLRKTGCFAHLKNYGILEIKGPDAGTFLQARTSNNVLALAAGQGQRTSILDRKGHVLALFSLHRLADNFLILAESSQINEILQLLQKYHFSEKVDFQIKHDQIWTIQGPKSDSLSAKITSSDIPVIKHSLTGESGYCFILPNKHSADEFETKVLAAGLEKIDQAELETARIEAGIPLYGIDINQDNLLPEIGQDEVYASYSKGCFTGQEVLARIKAQGTPKQGLAGLTFSDDKQTIYPLNTPVILDGKTIGTIKSNTLSPDLNCQIALAIMTREYRVPNQELTVEIQSDTRQIKIIVLPFYKSASNEQEAKILYEKALHEFTSGSETEAIVMLEQAISLKPDMQDAYETLGVMLSKQGEIDKAIELMSQLQSLAPDSIMSHSNLSVFYMQKGWKEKAEEEKAIAMSMTMAKLAREAKEKMDADDNREKQLAEATKRIEMFQQVLKIDDNDLLANHGLGALYVETKEFEKAIPYLAKALQVKPNHTVAYLALAEAYENTGNYDLAEQTYNSGIAVAAKRGDMTPLKEMEFRLNKLKQTVTKSPESIA